MLGRLSALIIALKSSWFIAKLLLLNETLITMKSPIISFSEWKHWTERSGLNGINLPGVYVLAHFEVVPEDFANPCSKEIIYIGETCDQNLQKRWYQFNRSAFQGKSGHSGGFTYREKFGGVGDKLFVAAYPVSDLDNNIRSFFIRYVERKLIWDFILSHGVAPECNRK